MGDHMANLFTEEDLINAVAKDIALRKATAQQARERLRRIEEVIDDSFIDNKHETEAQFLSKEVLKEYEKLKGY